VRVIVAATALIYAPYARERRIAAPLQAKVVSTKKA
jgi:hypothetical protein